MFSQIAWRSTFFCPAIAKTSTRTYFVCQKGKRWKHAESKPHVFFFVFRKPLSPRLFNVSFTFTSTSSSLPLTPLSLVTDKKKHPTAHVYHFGSLCLPLTFFSTFNHVEEISSKQRKATKLKYMLRRNQWANRKVKRWCFQRSEAENCKHNP